MATTAITLAATLQPDGVTLQLERKVALPAGKVTVTVLAAGARSGPTMLEVLDQIHRDQKQRGGMQMTDDEVAAQIAQIRAEDDDYEKRWGQIWSQTGEDAASTEKP